MTVARNAGEVLAEHATRELECIDRMYLNVYVPMLQSGAGTAHFFREVRGNPVPSSALMAQMTRRFVADMERFARDEGVDLVRFERFERKDDRTQAYLREFEGAEGVLYIGKAQEKARVVRTERREDPAHGPYPWLVPATAMVNHYYVYIVDGDFGPLFIKFCSYFPHNRTGFDAVSGYRHDAWWVKSLAFDLLYLDHLLLYLDQNAPHKPTAEHMEAIRYDLRERAWYALGDSMGFDIQTGQR